MTDNIDKTIQRTAPQKEYFRGETTEWISSSDRLYSKFMDIYQDNKYENLESFLDDVKFSKRELGHRVAIIVDNKVIGYIKGKDSTEKFWENVILRMIQTEKGNESAKVHADINRRALHIKVNYELNTQKENITQRDIGYILSKSNNLSQVKSRVENMRNNLKIAKKNTRKMKHFDSGGDQGYNNLVRAIDEQTEILQDMEKWIEINQRSGYDQLDQSLRDEFNKKLIALSLIGKKYGDSAAILVTDNSSKFSESGRKSSTNVYYGGNSKCDTAITTACIKARYGSFEEAFRQGGFAGAIGHAGDAVMETLGIKNQMSERQRLNAQKFLGLGLTVGAGILALNYVRDMFSGTTDDGKKIDRNKRGFNRGRAALLGGGFLGYQMFAGEKGYKQAGADLINYFMGDGTGQTNTLNTPRAGYAFTDASAKKRAEEIYKSYGGKSEAFTDEYYRQLFEKEGLVKKNSDTKESGNNTYGGVYEPYRDGQKDPNLVQNIVNIESTIPTEQQGRWTSIKPSVEKHINLLHQNNPNGRPIKLELVDVINKKFKIESYGNHTFLEVQAPDKILLYGPNDKAWNTPMKSISEAIRTASLVNRLSKNYKGKSKESRPRHVSNAGLGSGMSYNIEFEHESTQKALTERRWLPQRDSSDPELRDDWGSQFETLYPTIDMNKGNNAGNTGFVGFLNDFGIWNISS